MKKILIILLIIALIGTASFIYITTLGENEQVYQGVLV
jgi:uncharacterized protein YxeA